MCRVERLVGLRDVVVSQSVVVLQGVVGSPECFVGLLEWFGGEGIL